MADRGNARGTTERVRCAHAAGVDSKFTFDASMVLHLSRRMEQLASIPFIALRALPQPYREDIDESTSEEPLPSSVGTTARGTSPGTRVTMVADETTDDE